MKKTSLILLILFTFSLSSCSKKELIIVTTTSLENSGLLAYIIPYYEEEFGVKVKVIAMGTGAALELGELGQADILLVHAYESEMEFMDAGFGEKRSNIMYNDFIIVGPELLNDSTIEEVLNEIKDNHAFYSRGDNSGTHKKELYLWDLYGFDVSTFGDWYLEAGQGMGSTLTMTSLSQYYTLTDRSTYLSMIDNLDLVISYENPMELINQYGVIKVNPELHNRNDLYADQFYDWIIRQDTQDLIATYEQYGEQIFFPNS